MKLTYYGKERMLLCLIITIRVCDVSHQLNWKWKKKIKNLEMHVKPKFKVILVKDILRNWAKKSYKISDNMWLPPHLSVSTVNKPKLRLVLDSFSGVSLNSHLLSGLGQYNSIVGVLLKFREGEVAFAVAADIREMFHMK